jgi:RNA polymerase sigma factor (sigma-70 family)
MAPAAAPAEAGLRAIFLDRRPLVLRLLRARGMSVEEAEDVLQDLWLKLEQARPGPVSDPVAYLMRMATNLATDRRIAAARRTAREDAWGGLQPGGADLPDAEARMLSANELARLEALLGSMPERMRRALLMFRLEDRSQRAIAGELGMTVSGVEKVLARAYRQLIEFRKDGLSEGGLADGSIANSAAALAGGTDRSNSDAR